MESEVADDLSVGKQIYEATRGQKRGRKLISDTTFTMEIGGKEGVPWWKRLASEPEIISLSFFFS